MYVHVSRHVVVVYTGSGIDDGKEEARNNVERTQRRRLLYFNCGGCESGRMNEPSELNGWSNGIDQ